RRAPRTPAGSRLSAARSLTSGRRHLRGCRRPLLHLAPFPSPTRGAYDPSHGGRLPPVAHPAVPGRARGMALLAILARDETPPRPGRGTGRGLRRTARRRPGRLLLDRLVLQPVQPARTPGGLPGAAPRDL